jgi:signal transduction histidine kinase
MAPVRETGFWSSRLAPPRASETRFHTPWYPWARVIEPVLPYGLLAVATLLSLAHGGQDWPYRTGTLGLAALAAVWVLLTDTLPPARFQDTGWLAALCFAGTLAFAALLMRRDLLFLVFMISCFFQALRMKPVPLALLGLAATSLLINSIPSGGPGTAVRENPYLYLTVVLVQAGAIGGGSIVATKVARQNEERRQALEKLEAALNENAGLHRQLLAQAREAGVLDERQRLSREIHDTLAQGLTGIITQLEATEQAAGNRAEWRRHLDTASALARENLAEARRSVHALRPEALDSARLPDALRGVTKRWGERAALPVEFTTTGTVRPLHPEIEATLLRITQEALSNVAKHAGATRVGMTLSYMEDQVTLDVRDDGTGFAPDSLPCNGNAHGGFGVSGMRHRLRRLAGTLDIESEPGSGTAISATVPAIGDGTGDGTGDAAS